MKVVKILGERQTGKTSMLFQEFLKKCNYKNNTILIIGGKDLCDKVKIHYNIQPLPVYESKIPINERILFSNSVETNNGGWYNYVFIDNDYNIPTDVLIEQIKDKMAIDDTLYITEAINDNNEIIKLDKPIEDKFYLRHRLADIIGHKDYMFLQISDDEKLSLSNNEQFSMCKTQFTKSEIENMPFDVDQFFDILKVPYNERVD